MSPVGLVHVIFLEFTTFTLFSVFSLSDLINVERRNVMIISSIELNYDNIVVRRPDSKSKCAALNFSSVAFKKRLTATIHFQFRTSSKQIHASS